MIKNKRHKQETSYTTKNGLCGIITVTMLNLQQVQSLPKPIDKGNHNASIMEESLTNETIQNEMIFFYKKTAT